MFYYWDMDNSVMRISRKVLADKTGMHKSIISRFLTGKRIPDFKQAKLMADALEMSLDELYATLYPSSDK